jgi:hypothetical protein
VAELDTAGEARVVSEYQYYEFLAVDRPLSKAQRAQLRALSTRAEITATRFTNEYQWGDFRGDPRKMMEQYFDAHLYFANWGTRRLMLRVPRAALDTKTAEQYFYGDTAASFTVTGEHLIIDLYADREPDDYWEETPDLGFMVGVRSELIAGDCRLLYLAWLFAVQHDELDDEATEPPVPAGLAELSAPLEAVVEFLEIDEDLIDIAVEASPDLGEDEPDGIGEWIASLPVPAKDELLRRVASGEGVQVQALLLRQFRESVPGRPAAAGAPARTVSELRDAAAAYKAEIAKAVAERWRAEAAEKEVKKAAAYAKHLDHLSAREASAWVRAAALIETKNQRDYDTAVTLLCDLRALAERNGSLEVFTVRVGDLRRQHQRKPSLMERFDAAGLA